MHPIIKLKQYRDNPTEEGLLLSRDEATRILQSLLEAEEERNTLRKTFKEALSGALVNGSKGKRPTGLPSFRNPGAYISTIQYWRGVALSARGELKSVRRRGITWRHLAKQESRKGTKVPQNNG